MESNQNALEPLKKYLDNYYGGMKFIDYIPKHFTDDDVINKANFIQEFIDLFRSNRRHTDG